MDSKPCKDSVARSVSMVERWIVYSTGYSRIGSGVPHKRVLDRFRSGKGVRIGDFYFMVMGFVYKLLPEIIPPLARKIIACSHVARLKVGIEINRSLYRAWDCECA